MLKLLETGLTPEKDGFTYRKLAIIEKYITCWNNP